MHKVVKRRDGTVILHVDGQVAQGIADATRGGDLDSLSEEIGKKIKSEAPVEVKDVAEVADEIEAAIA